MIFSNKFVSETLRQTRVSSHSTTLPDYILVEDVSTVETTGIWKNDVSDRFTGFTELCSELTKKTKRFPLNIVKEVEDAKFIFLMLSTHNFGMMSCK